MRKESILEKDILNLIIILKKEIKYNNHNIKESLKLSGVNIVMFIRDLRKQNEKMQKQIEELRDFIKYSKRIEKKYLTKRK